MTASHSNESPSLVTSIESPAENRDSVIGLIIETSTSLFLASSSNLFVEYSLGPRERIASLRDIATATVTTL